MHTLTIKDLCVNIDNKVLLDNFNLEIKSNETHTIMGPNGVGKSTLSRVIMGDSAYKIVSGDILYDGESILNKSVDERARLGIYLAMQSPIQVEGVSNADFLRTACSSKNEKFKLMSFIKDMEIYSDKLKLNKDFIHRGVNEGFSGGERKKNEILQMYMLKPSIVMLDEIDSGLDVDSLKIVGDNIVSYKEESNCGILIITHYQRLLNYLKTDYVHIMINGHIVKSGDNTLVKYIEENGYEQFLNYSLISKKNNKNSSCVIKDILKDE